MSNKLKDVWVIDNDPIFTFIIKRQCELTNFSETLTIMDDAEKALSQLRVYKDKPQIIFLDINLPLFDGWQFLNEFSKEFVDQGMVIYLVSSSIDPKDYEKAKTYSFVEELIGKPVSEKTLLQIKDRYLRGK
jgi:CheY-like chemotaxis protein